MATSWTSRTKPSTSYKYVKENVGKTWQEMDTTKWDGVGTLTWAGLAGTAFTNRTKPSATSWSSRTKP